MVDGGRIFLVCLLPYAHCYLHRICPGMAFSTDSLFVMAASFLAAFDVTAPKDEAGNIIPLKLEFKGQALAYVEI